MRVKVYYAGDKPCIQEVAIAISEEIKSSSIPLPPSYPPENLALAFIGTQAKGKKPDQRALEFIRMLDKKRVESAALFCTSSAKDGACLDVLRAALTERGIKVIDETLICNGKGMFGGKMPTPEDIAAAKDFTNKYIADFTGQP